MLAQTIVFSDLDGTLLGHSSYSFDAATDALDALKKEKIPLVICTSKTRAEIEQFQKKLKINEPFITENGGAIFVPKNYFDFDYSSNKTKGNYNVIELGTPISKLLQVLENVKQKGYAIKSFSDMSVSELARDCGLKNKDAKAAKAREYDEAFKIDKKEDAKEIARMIKKAGYNTTAGGRYYHIMGDNDKGKAVKILTALFKRKYKNIRTIGLGDGKNDIPMLKQVDVPIVVKNSVNKPLVVDFKAYRTKQEAPLGWMEAVLKFALNKA